MPDILVEGTYKLNGSVKVQGAKNSVLPIIAATVLCGGVCHIENCPKLSDVDASVKILEHLGAKCHFSGNILSIDPSGINDYVIPDNLMREMRSSSLFLGAILGRMGKARISSPGGCELGPRPIDLHIKSLKCLGADVIEHNGCVSLDVQNGLIGKEIHLSFPSVGATENTILAAVTAKGVTIIDNAAKEPEIEDLADFLKSAGAKIYGAGNDRIIVEGVKRLSSATHKIIPDRIVAATYISCVSSTGGDIELKDVNPAHIRSIISLYKEAGCEFSETTDSIRVKSNRRLKSVSTVRTLTYPGFPTDAGPALISSLSIAKGTTIFVENIFQNRFRYIDELKRFGANVQTEDRVAIIKGVKNLSGAVCECPDLRGGSALLVAALAARGNSVIKKTEHIKRGYEDIVFDISNLGGHILYI
ncbi:MAG: UDP-N-acetylglucosamine 1-carboxyvinyltransferase [Clostridia bacterium]|nr:UDP-N-acetylglucosamine 1-carboxyvinyltransferase [Clostridia bacterium]